MKPPIIRFSVIGRAVPWKAPTVLRRGGAFKDPKLLAWQAEVSKAARVAMAGREPIEGPVELTLEFYLRGKAGSPPDLSNLVKATEDALQGSAIVNDRQVGSIISTRHLKQVEDGACVLIRVIKPREV